MNIGAAFGFYQDMAERRELLRMVHEPEMGFAERADGVWTWTFKQNELRKAVEAPSGSAVRIAGVMGFPFIRLRAALPAELFAGSVAQSLGRRDGLSVTGLMESRDENMEVMTQLRRSMSCFTCGAGSAREQIPALFEEEEAAADTKQQQGKHQLAPPRAQSLVHTSLVAAPPPAHQHAHGGGGKPRMLIFDYDDALSVKDLEVYTRPADPNELVGTAVMFAFLANQHVLPVMELSVRMAAAKEYFRGVRVPGIDHEFDSLLPKFMTMLGAEGGALTVRAKWMATARLWRLLFLQREEGCWDMTDSLAFALEAHEGQPPPKKKKANKGVAALVALCAGGGELEDNLDDAADDAMGSDDEAEPAAAEEAKEAHPEAHHKRVKDCPISFSAAAMRHHMPAALLALNDTYDDPALQRSLSRLTSRFGSRAALAHTPLPGHAEEAEASEASEASEADAASASGSMHGPVAAEPSAQPAGENAEPAVAEPGAEPTDEADDAECAVEPAAEGGSGATTADDDSAQPPTDEPAAEPAAAEPAAAAVGTGAAWSGADGYGARITLLNGYGAPSRGTPSPAATTHSDAAFDADAGALKAARAARPRVPVERIWATLLSIEVLENMDVCWLVDDEPEEGEERTIVDAAREWLEAQGEADPRVAELLESGELSRAADKTIASWKAIMEHNIAEVRRLDVLNRFTALTHLQRATGRVIKSVMTDHGAFGRGRAVVHACCQVC